MLGRADWSNGLHRCVLDVTVSIFLRRRLESYHSKRISSWWSKPSNATLGEAAAMQLDVFDFSSFSWVLTDRAGGEIEVAAALILFENTPAGYAVLWPAPGGAPVCHPSLRFTICRIFGTCRKCPNSDGLPRGCCPSGNITWKLDVFSAFIRKKSIWFA